MIQKSDKSFQEDVFRACAHQMQKLDDKERLKALSQKRRESIDLLHKQRIVRIEKEKIAKKELW